MLDAKESCVYYIIGQDDSSNPVIVQVATAAAPSLMMLWIFVSMVTFVMVRKRSSKELLQVGSIPGVISPHHNWVINVFLGSQEWMSLGCFDDI